jgi:hypothetical protein
VSRLTPAAVVLELTGRIHEVEPETGNIVRTIETERAFAVSHTTGNTS